jgi:ABC-type phosphate/phosphonate transport system substrate-binding protein
MRLAAESPVQSRRVVRLGVLANDTPGACHRRWGATADYLTSELPGYRFELIPIAFGDIVPTVKDGGVDLLLTNPAQTIELTSLDLALPVATLRGSFYGGDYAGVIFWSARRFDIQGARDVRGRTIAAVSSSSLGGWLMQLLEYQEAGIDLQTECHVAFLQSHEDAVRSVLAGQADIGFCRTGVLEAMSSRGEISPDDIRIGTDFAAQGTRGPQHHSTRLYPEWPLLALNHVPRDVASNIRRVLLDMPPDDDAALQSGTAGWIVAANYGEVRRCLRTLGAPPFGDEQEYRRFSTTSIRVLGGVAIAGVFAVLVCAILFLRLRSVRHQLETELEHENTLGRSRSFLAAVVGSFPYPVVVIGLDYRVLLANPKARDAYGWEGVEDGIMPCHRFMRERGHPCHDSDDECLLRKVIDSGQAETVHTTHRYTNGEEAPVRVHGVPLFGPDGQLHAVVEWAVDEREEAAVPQASAFPAS